MVQWMEKLEIGVSIAGEPGETQVRGLLARVSHIGIQRDGLHNWLAELLDARGYGIELLWYQNADPDDVDGDEGGPITVCRPWDGRAPLENEAEMRLSPEWHPLAIGVLMSIANASRFAFQGELAARRRQMNSGAHAVVVASSQKTQLCDLAEVARDDPAIIPILRDAWREELP